MPRKHARKAPSPGKGLFLLILLGLPVASSFTSCGHEEEKPLFSPQELEQLLREVPRPAPPRVITDIREKERKPSPPTRKRRLRGRTVKDATRLRTPEFRLAFIRRSYHDVDLGQRTVLEILSFTGPLEEYPAPHLLPLDIKEVREEALHLVQRSPLPARVRILKDWEIFLVFKAAYDTLTPEARRALIRRWKAAFGSAPPAAPERDRWKGPFPPLFWLRTDPIFWDRGGRFWWWAAHCLMRDDGFHVLEDGRVWIQLREGGSAFHS